MAGKRPAPRLQILDDKQMNAQQRTLVQALRSGPRGHSIQIRGPFAAFLHAPVFGNLAQELRRALPLQHGGAAPALGIRHSLHGAAVARAI